MSLAEDIRKKIEKELQPIEVKVEEISVEERKYSVYIVSEIFENLSLVKRHQKVNNLFHDDLISGKIHALSITAKPPGPN